ncbi:hypothetical protein Tco_0486360 [Tanacetum coccineum]
MDHYSLLCISLSFRNPLATVSIDAVSSLIPLSRGSFDVIVGMDWLSKRKFVIVCHEKVVRIPLEGDEILRVHGERTQGVVKTLMNTKLQLRQSTAATLLYHIMFLSNEVLDIRFAVLSTKAILHSELLGLSIDSISTGISCLSKRSTYVSDGNYVSEIIAIHRVWLLQSG